MTSEQDIVSRYTRENAELVARLVEERVQQHILAMPDGAAMLAQLATLTRERDGMQAELLRCRTTEYAAAHAIDNMGIEIGLGAGATPIVVQDNVRSLARARDSAYARGRAAGLEEAAGMIDGMLGARSEFSRRIRARIAAQADGEKGGG